MTKLLGKIFYYPLKYQLWLSTLFYFKRIQFKGIRHVPRDKAVIYASNHQNALLDALIVSTFSRRAPYFLTRANVFKNPKAGDFLRGLKMLPIYRFRDGLANVKKNDNTFEEAIKVLEQQGVVGVFPEGNHALQYSIRKLQKGLARIAFGANERNQHALDIKVLPIGIYYENYYSSRGRVLVNMGEAIDLQDYTKEHQADERRGYEALLEELSHRMKKLSLHFPDGADYDKLKKEFDKQRIYKNDMLKQLQADQKLVDALHHGTPYNEKTEKPSFLLRIYWAVRKVAQVITYPAHRLINSVVASKVKDPHFIGSIRFVLTTFLYPPYLVLLAILLWSLFGIMLP